MKKIILSAILLLSLLLPAFSEKEIKLSEDRVVVYYFHAWLRNLACTNIEEAAKKAVTENFKKDYEAGKINFKVFDIDKPDYAHYKDEYDFASERALVLVQLKAGAEVKNKVLQKAAVLAEDEKKLAEYIVKEITNFKKEEKE